MEEGRLVGLWGKRWRTTRACLLVILCAGGGLLVTTVTKAGAAAELRPDLRTHELPTTSGIYVNETIGGGKEIRFGTGWENAGSGPFEVTPGDPASDDCNNNGNALDDYMLKQNVYRDSNSNGVFERGIDTSVTTSPAGCMFYDGHPTHEHFHVHEMGVYRLLSEATGSTIDTTSKVTFCLVDFTLFNGSLPGAPASQHYNSCDGGIQGISVGWFDFYSSGFTGQELDVTGAPAGNYCLRADADGGSIFAETNESNNRTEQRYFIDPESDVVTPLAGACTFSGGGGAPLNDPFASPFQLQPGTTSSTNADATTEPGEPVHGGRTGGSSVWYEWTPSAAGSVTIDTCGSAFDTLLAAYTGSAVNALTLVQQNDDSSTCGTGSQQSSITFDASPGVTYKVAVDGYADTDGVFSLTLNQEAGPPANDDFVDAAGFTAKVAESNVDATKEPGEPAHAGNAGGKSLWYTWTATTASAVTIDACNSDFNTLLAVYTGATVDSLTEVASNDDSGNCPGPPGSFVTFSPTPGETYMIAVDGSGGAAGQVHMMLSQPGPPNDNLANAESLPDLFDITSSTVGASKELGEPNHAGVDGGASIWYSWTSPVTSPIAIDTCDSAYDSTLAVYTGTDFSDLDEQASDDDGCGATGGGSSLTLNATEGIRYLIAVDGYLGDTGTVALEGGVDVADPVTTILSGPTGNTNDDTPTFTFTSETAGATFECRFDSAPFEDCVGQIGQHTPNTALPLGPHTFEVRGLEGANIEQTPASRSFSVVADPTISIANVKQKEGNRGQKAFTFTVTLSAASDEQVTVALATADGRAKAGKDYVAGSGVATFAPGTTTQRFTVLVNGDRRVEPNEKFSVGLSSPTNAAIFVGTGVGTIKNDDSAS